MCDLSTIPLLSDAAADAWAAVVLDLQAKVDAGELLIDTDTAPTAERR